MKGNKISIEASILYATAGKLGPDVIATLQNAAKKYAKRSSNITQPNTGDLTTTELAAIQQCADKFKLDIVVVGSALYGKRIKHNANAEIGHRSHCNSDIDYIIPNKENQPLFAIGPFDGPEEFKQKPQAMLPERDLHQGILFTSPHIYLHRLWFKPNARPRLLPPGIPNLALEPPSPELYE